MALNAALVIFGLLLAWLTLRDVFETVVVPGGSRASLRVTRRLVSLLLPAWKRIRGRRRGISGTFAPVVLVGSFLVWITLLVLAFGLMAYAARAQFVPRVTGFWDAVYAAGGAIVTIGLSESSASGAARWVVLAAGFCGLAVITLAVTYLLLVQSSVARRDTGILKLNTSAGVPPSALDMLEKFAAIGNRGELPEVLRECRDWCVTVRQSHASHPSLIYFQSVGAGAGWPAALGALLDLALLAETCLDEEGLHGPAVLLREDARSMAVELAGFVGLKPKPQICEESELRTAARRLEAAGYRLQAAIDYEKMARQRSDLQACVTAMAEHLGKPEPVLVR
jgi:hypothetical protein